MGHINVQFAKRPAQAREDGGELAHIPVSFGESGPGARGRRLPLRATHAQAGVRPRRARTAVLTQNTRLSSRNPAHAREDGGYHSESRAPECKSGPRARTAGL